MQINTLTEMGQFGEQSKLQELIQEEKENINKWKTLKNLTLQLRNLPLRKFQAQRNERQIHSNNRTIQMEIRCSLSKNRKNKTLPIMFLYTPDIPPGNALEKRNYRSTAFITVTQKSQQKFTNQRPQIPAKTNKPTSTHTKMKNHNQVGFPGGSAVRKACLQCRGCGFDPWVSKITWN